MFKIEHLFYPLSCFASVKYLFFCSHFFSLGYRLYFQLNPSRLLNIEYDVWEIETSRITLGSLYSVIEKDKVGFCVMRKGMVNSLCDQPMVKISFWIILS